MEHQGNMFCLEMSNLVYKHRVFLCMCEHHEVCTRSPTLSTSLVMFTSICSPPTICSAETPSRCTSHAETATLRCNSTSQVVVLQTKSWRHREEVQHEKDARKQHPADALLPYLTFCHAVHLDRLQRRERGKSQSPACLIGDVLLWKVKGCVFLGQTDQTEIHFVTCCVTDVTGATERIWHLSDGWRDRGRQMLMLCRKCRGAEHIQSKC